MSSKRGRVPRNQRRFLLKDSDRSGFKHFRIELVRDGPFLVHPSEFDTPPPSNESLGGKGDGVYTGELSKAERETVDHNPTVPDFK